MMDELIVNNSRTCAGDPLPQIFDATRCLDAAVTDHLQDKHALAEELIRAADMPEIYKWLKPIGANCETQLVHPPKKNQFALSKDLRAKVRMPTATEK